MSTLPVRASSVAASPAPGLDLGGLIAAIAADTGLSAARRRLVAHSLTWFCRTLELDPALPVDQLPRLAERMRQFPPPRAGITRRSWQNRLAAVRFALRRVGTPLVPARSLVLPSPAWQALLDPMEDRYACLRITRFARWCTSQAVEPAQVDQAVFERFRAGLLIVPRAPRSAAHTAQQVCRFWNHAVDNVPGWPPARLDAGTRSARWTLPLDGYPASLQADVEAYLAWAAGLDLFAEDGPRRAHRPKTREHRRLVLRAYLGALVVQGVDPASLAALADAVTVERATLALRYLLTRSRPGQVGRVHQVAHTVHLVARDWLRLDADQLTQLKRMVARLAARKPIGLTAENRRRLQQFDDPRNVGAILHLPADLLREAERGSRAPRASALLVQIAVAIEILLMTGLRRANLGHLHVERHISWTRAGRTGIAHVVVPAEEVKNNEPLEFELPAESSKLLRRYLDVYRPRLTQAPSPWLFRGRWPEKPKAASMLAKQIMEVVRDRTGIELHLHGFRHLSVKLFLDVCPGQYEVVRRFLGHRRLATTTDFYAGSETAAAVRHYDEQILERRRQGFARPGRRRRDPR